MPIKSSTPITIGQHASREERRDGGPSTGVPVGGSAGLLLRPTLGLDTSFTPKSRGDSGGPDFLGLHSLSTSSLMNDLAESSLIHSFLTPMDRKASRKEPFPARDEGGPNPRTDMQPDLLDADSFLNSKQCLGRSQRLVSGTQFRMPSKEVLRCENCDELDRSLRKSKETIRSLKLQMNRLEDRVIDLKKSKNGIAEPGATASSSSGASRINDELRELNQRLQKKCEEQEAELAKLKKLLIGEKLNNDDLRRNIDERENALNSEINALGALLNTEKSERKELESSLVKATEKQTILSQKAQVLDSKLIETQRLLEQARAPPQDLIDEIARLQLSNSSLTTSVAQLNDTIEFKKLELNKLVSQLENERIKSTYALQAKDADIQNLVKQYDSLNAKVQSTEALVSERDERIRALELTMSDQMRSESNLRSQNNLLQNEIQSLKRQIEELNCSMILLKDSSQKVMQTAIAGSIRLCVVAPTVNAHISDKQIKLHGNLSEMNLRNFLRQEILTKYSFLYKQEGEELGPDGKTPLQPWIDKMLSDMQQSIEHHVNSAMEASK